MRRGELTDLVEAALIRGRGGAGFPLADKLKAAAGARKAPEVMVNGAESEPASVKDRMLLSRAPHLVLDGAQLLADEVGARGVTVWVHDFAAADTLGRAIAERDDPVPVTVVRAPDGYLAGESSAALAHLGGRAALPAFTLRPAAEQGGRQGAADQASAADDAHTPPSEPPRLREARQFFEAAAIQLFRPCDAHPRYPMVRAGTPTLIE